MALLPPGVPPLLSKFNVVFGNASLVFSDAAQIFNLINATPQWGIFDQNGQPVIVGDSVVAVDYTQEARVSNYPVEQGGFESFNKVQLPFDLKFTFTKGGTVSDRAAFLAAVDKVQKSLTLFTGLMPETHYDNINVSHYDFRRTHRNGVTLLTVDVWCQEIRLAPALLFSNAQTFGQAVSNTKNPEAASPTNDGTVQAVNPSSQVTTPATSSTPGTIQTPNTAITNSTGNSLPQQEGVSFVRTIPANGSSVVYDTGAGPQSGTVASTDTFGKIYTLTDGTSVNVNSVKSITPPGFATVQ